MKLPFWYLTFQEQHSLISRKKTSECFFLHWEWLFAVELWNLRGRFLSFNKAIGFHLPKSLLCLLFHGTRFSKVHPYLCSIVMCWIFSLGIILTSPWISIYVNSASLNCLNSVSCHNKPSLQNCAESPGRPYDILLLIHFEVHSSHLFNKFMATNNFVVLTILLNSLAFHNICRGPSWTNYTKGRPSSVPIHMLDTLHIILLYPTVYNFPLTFVQEDTSGAGDLYA